MPQTQSLELGVRQNLAQHQDSTERQSAGEANFESIGQLLLGQAPGFYQ